MTKVLHLLYTSLPEKSGSSIRSHALIKAQQENKIDPHVLVAPFIEGVSKDSEVITEGVTYNLTKSSKFHKSENISSLKELILKGASLYRFLSKAFSTIKKNKIEAIHSHSMFYCAITGAICSLIFRIPHVYEVRSFWELRSKTKAPLRYRLYRFLENISILLADEIVVISNSMKQDIQSRGRRFRNKPVTIVYNGLDEKEIRKNQEQSEVKKINKNAPIVLGYVGNISSIEGLAELIHYINKQSQHKLELHLYGLGNDEDRLNQIVQKHNYSNIVFHGKFEKNQLLEIYSNIDVVVIPRKPVEICEKVTPLKPLEAISFSKPVICSDVGGLLELFDYDKSLLYFYNKNDISSISRIFDELLNKSQDDLEKNIAKSIEFIINKRSWQKNTKQYDNLYKKLIKN